MAELWVVATPIGNLNDLTPRMREALEKCDLIAAEDTRVTMKLLSKLDVRKPMVSSHRHNEMQKADGLIEKMLREDMTVALVCDAGTPGISDPGSPVVRAAIEAGIRVVPICGPCAAVAAISASGFDAREFAFYGFLPREKKPLREKLEKISKGDVRVAVFYESPHRVVDLVEMISEVSPECMLSVACDISKLYEKIDTGTCEEVLARLRVNENVEKGEYCVVCAFPEREEAEETPNTAASVEARMVELLLAGLSMRQASETLMEQGVSRNDAYRAKLRLSRLFGEE